MSDPHPVTPDGRYFVVNGRLWRRSDPSLPPDRRQELVRELMDARRRVGSAVREGDAEAEQAARTDVHRAKVALGERGPVWWTDGAPDVNRRMARNTPYAEWWKTFSSPAYNGGGEPPKAVEGEQRETAPRCSPATTGPRVPAPLPGLCDAGED